MLIKVLSVLTLVANKFAVGAAVAVVGIAAYRVYAARKNASS
jgi:hypothetical protein